VCSKEGNSRCDLVSAYITSRLLQAKHGVGCDTVRFGRYKPLWGSGCFLLNCIDSTLKMDIAWSFEAVVSSKLHSVFPPKTVVFIGTRLELQILQDTGYYVKIKDSFATFTTLVSSFHSGLQAWLYRGADKSLARPTFRCIFFDGENISFDACLILYIYIYINSNNISQIMIINRIYFLLALHNP
jgi:hypothetical protein